MPARADRTNGHVTIHKIHCFQHLKKRRRIEQLQILHNSNKLEKFKNISSNNSIKLSHNFVFKIAPR